MKSPAKRSISSPSQVPRKHSFLSCLRFTIVGSDALPSWIEAQSSNMSTAALRFLNSALALKNKEEKVKLFK